MAAAAVVAATSTHAPGGNISGSEAGGGEAAATDGIKWEGIHFLPRASPELKAGTTFLQDGDDCARDVVRNLLEEVAESCDADAEFYSAPGGAGRKGVQIRGKSVPGNECFVLVYSTSEYAVLEREAQAEVVPVLRAAAVAPIPLEQEEALSPKRKGSRGDDDDDDDEKEATPMRRRASFPRGTAISMGRFAASAVISSFGLEGILLVRTRSPDDILEGTQPIHSCDFETTSVEIASTRVAALEQAAKLLEDEARVIESGGFSIGTRSDPTCGIRDLSGFVGPSAPSSTASTRAPSPVATTMVARAEEIAQRMSAVTTEYEELLEAFPSAVVGGALSQGPAPVTPMEVLPLVRFFSCLLAERLEKLHWRAQARAAAKALAETLHALDALQDPPNPGNSKQYVQLLEAVGRVLPPEVLRGSVSADRVDIWSYDPEAGQVVLNNNGRMEGMRMPVDGSIVGQVATSESNDVLSVKDFGDTGLDVSHKRKSVAAFITQSVVCIPLQPYVVPDRPEKAQLKQVIEFSTSKESSDSLDINACTKFDHFEMVAAEALRTSILPLTLRLRDTMMSYLYDMHKHQGVTQMAKDLAGAMDAKSMVTIIERDMPKVLNCGRCTMFFVSEELAEVWAPPTVELPAGILMDIGEGFPGEVANKAILSRINHEAGTEKCIFIDNKPQDSEFWFHDFPALYPHDTKNLLLAPVWSLPKNDEVVAIIQLANKKEDDLEDGHSGFVDKDKVLLMALLRECAKHVQRLMVDIMISKAKMGDDGETDSKTEGSSIVEAYYGAAAAGRKKKQTIVRSVEPVQVAQMLGIISSTASHTLRSEAWRLVQGTVRRRLLRADLVNMEVGLEDWAIDYWSLDDYKEFTLFSQALQRTGVLKGIPLPPRDVIQRYFADVKREYTNTPYHNIKHAIATVHYAYKLTTAAELQNHITKLGWFALIVGAMAHDAGHRGRNNAFEVITRSDLALRYNDASVLENHSCARAFEIALHDQKKNIFKEMSIDQFGNIRKQMVASIIATDMTYHVEHVKMLQEFSLQANLDADGVKDQSQSLISTFLHAADIANPLMPLAIAQRWGRCVIEEFVAQASEEERLGIPVASHMQNLDNPIVAAKSQLGFMDFVIMPFFGSIFRSFEGLSDVHENLKEHRDATVGKAEGGSPGGRRMTSRGVGKSLSNRSNRSQRSNPPGR